MFTISYPLNDKMNRTKKCKEDGILPPANSPTYESVKGRLRLNDHGETILEDYSPGCVATEASDPTSVVIQSSPSSRDVQIQAELSQKHCSRPRKRSSTTSLKDREHLDLPSTKDKHQTSIYGSLMELNEAVKNDDCKRRSIRICFVLLYILLAILAVVATYSLIYDLVRAMNHPVRSINFKKVRTYPAPGIAVYPGGAKLLACGHYYNNIVTSKIKLTQLDLVNTNCSYANITYRDPLSLNESYQNALIFRGPTGIHKEDKEAVFLHFMLEDDYRDFYTVSYFVFHDWEQFNQSGQETMKKRMLAYHGTVPTYALSAGFRIWSKLSMKDTYMMDGNKYTEFKVEYSIVRFWDRRSEVEQERRKLFFIFFEWKNDLIEESFLLYTTTPWSIGAALCGVFLTLHRGYQLAKTSYRKMQKEKQRRKTIRNKTRGRSQEPEVNTTQI